MKRLTKLLVGFISFVVIGLIVYFIARGGGDKEDEANTETAPIAIGSGICKFSSGACIPAHTTPFQSRPLLTQQLADYAQAKGLYIDLGGNAVGDPIDIMSIYPYPPASEYAQIMQLIYDGNKEKLENSLISTKRYKLSNGTYRLDVKITDALEDPEDRPRAIRIAEGSELSSQDVDKSEIFVDCGILALNKDYLNSAYCEGAPTYEEMKDIPGGGEWNLHSDYPSLYIELDN